MNCTPACGQVLNPLSEARDWTCILAMSMPLTRWTTRGTPSLWLWGLSLGLLYSHTIGVSGGGGKWGSTLGRDNLSQIWGFSVYLFCQTVKHKGETWGRCLSGWAQAPDHGRFVGRAQADGRSGTNFHLGKITLQCEGSRTGGQKPGQWMSEQRWKIEPWREEEGWSQNHLGGKLDGTSGWRHVKMGQGQHPGF